MPPAPRFASLNRRSLLAAGAISFALALALLLSASVRCALWIRHGDDVSCQLRSTLHGAVGLALLLLALWLSAALTQVLLPRRQPLRNGLLALQVIGLTLLGALLNRKLHAIGAPDVRVGPYALQILLTFSACICLGLEYRQRGRYGQLDAERLSHAEQDQARQLDAARAALLQAQVEPHFLFNTLAHLRRLASTDAVSAHAMLTDLRRYLAAALPELRQAETPLARELELVRAFLALHQRRIGPDRLRLHFDVAPGLDDTVVPSTCLLTLAENAIKHGIAPQVEGGDIHVRAVPDPDDPALLRLEVADTGAGMGSSSGSGTGLATLRARLAAAHGSAAKLSLHLNQPRGLIARVQLPWP